MGPVSMMSDVGRKRGNQGCRVEGYVPEERNGRKMTTEPYRQYGDVTRSRPVLTSHPYGKSPG